MRNMSDPTIGDWAAVAAAVFTAAAAGAAFLTARQGHEQLEAADRPLLEVQVLADPQTSMARLSIINTGRGVARGCDFAIHAAGLLTDGVLGDGFVAAGQRLHVVTDIPLPRPEGKLRADLPDLAVMVAYRDAEGFAHYRTHAGAHRTPKTLIRRRPKYPDRVDVFRKLYPHVSVRAAKRANSEVISAG
jgi:hypothetical protein